MARSLEARLAALRGDPTDAEVEGALRSTTGILVATAVSIAIARGILVEEFAPAFTRLTDKGDKRDPGCRGKVAIARALLELDRWEDAVFEAGVRLVQREPVWGGTVDTAAELRGVCGIGFARSMRKDTFDVLAALLADPERMTRAAAATGLGDTGQREVSALLRFKLLTGDAEPEVLSACCESLLHIQKDDAIDFLARLLAHEDDRADVAALALGGSKLAGAVPALLAWDPSPERRRRVAYLAIALTREANDHLLAIVEDGEPADALAAARALATFRDDPVLRAALTKAARGRREITAVLQG